MGTRRTMFEGVQSLLPGHYLKIAFRRDGKPAEIVERQYWDLDFPDAGSEENPQNDQALVDEFEATFRRAVEIRLRADVPVVSYLSGGVDSAYVLATASKLRGAPVPSFTIRFPARASTRRTTRCSRRAPSAAGRPSCAATAPSSPTPIRSSSPPPTAR